MKASTYFFMGKISDDTSRFQVQQEPMGKLFLEVYIDGIAIWGATRKKFDNFWPEIKEAFEIIISTYIFKTKKPITYSIVDWVEAKETISRENIIGWIIGKHKKGTPRPRRSKFNTPWKKAASIYPKLVTMANHRLALKDFKAAMLDSGDDAFFFAYRAVEDICRAITGATEIGKSEWQAMHKTIGTRTTQIKPITKVSKKIRHGDVENNVVKRARKNRDFYLDIARDVIFKEFKRTFPEF